MGNFTCQQLPESTPRLLKRARMAPSTLFITNAVPHDYELVNQFFHRAGGERVKARYRSCLAFLGLNDI
jgi:hypothetical protein